MQQPQKPAAEAEAQRGRGLHVIGEARIIETQLPHRLAQILEARRIDREETGKDDRLRRLEARQGASAAGRFSSVTVSPTRVSATCLMAAVKKPISPGPRLSTISFLGREMPTRSI